MIQISRTHNLKWYCFNKNNFLDITKRPPYNNINKTYSRSLALADSSCSCPTKRPQIWSEKPRSISKVCWSKLWWVLSRLESSWSGLKSWWYWLKKSRSCLESCRSRFETTMLRDRRGTLCGRLASMLEGQNSFKKMDLKHNKNWMKWLDILIIVLGKSQKYLNQHTFLTTFVKYCWKKNSEIPQRSQKSTNTR